MAPGARAVDRIALVGLSGSGKSAVGAALAQRLHWAFVDTDAAVEAATGRTIHEIFDRQGEEEFRRLELAALGEALDRDGPMVIACGGGLIAQSHGREALLAATCVVWLDADDDTLLRRVGAGASRPLLSDDPARRLAEMRSTRQPWHLAASIRVATGDVDIDSVCDRITDAVSGTRLGTVSPRGGRRDVHVALDDRSYTVIVGRGVAAGIADQLPPASSRVAVIVDRAVLPLGRRIAAAVHDSGRRPEVITLQGGEAVKTWATAGRVVARLAKLRLGRDDAVVAVGGGSIGDLAGFCAATYLRGVACLQVPTTLLAMVDSGLGGKTGVNLPSGKNLAGAFWQPRAVVCDLDALATLGDRDYRSAFSEIVKYSMVADASLSTVIDSGIDALLARDLDTLAAVIERCCAAKATVVAADEREAGRRAILNYGHTVGHALEATTQFSDALHHGEAVACGMRVAGALSVRVLGCPAEQIQWQDGVLARFGLGTAPRLDVDAVLDATHADKKARSGIVRWVLIEQRGRASFGHIVPEGVVRDALVEVIEA
jgi:shikimate kinase/3-dehydroquinate synthase